jgi:hypothetical protein
MGSTNSGSDCVVRRKTGRTVQDEDTGLEVPEWADVHTGPTRLKGTPANFSPSQSLELPGGELQVGQRTAHFPVSVTGLRDDDWIDVTAGENEGTVWRIVEADFADQQTARRLPVVAEQRPAEWA